MYFQVGMMSYILTFKMKYEFNLRFCQPSWVVAH